MWWGGMGSVGHPDTGQGQAGVEYVREVFEDKGT